MSSDPPYLDRVVAGSVPAILIEGPDARAFAQSQLAGDVAALAPGHWQWNAWLDARGRVQALLRLADPGDGNLLALLRGGRPDSIAGMLQRYVFRQRVTLRPCTFVARGGGPLAEGAVARNGDAWVLGLGGRRLSLAPGSAPEDPDAGNAWRLLDIRQGWPLLPDDVPLLLPPALGLARLRAVSFDKGCYPGQEIVARLHYRGGHKLRLHHVRSPAPLPHSPVAPSGDPSRAYLLASAGANHGVEALLVAPVGTSPKINYLDVCCEIVSIFDP